MDRKLVRKTLSGDHQAFNRLIERYGQVLYAHIARKIRYPSDVEDFVQETFLAAFSQLHRLRDPDRFLFWLKGIADNLIRMGYRRRYVQLRWEDALSAEDDDHQAQEESFEEREMRMALREAIGHLSAIQREVLTYHYFKGYSYEETADLLDLRVDTVRSRLQKARIHLKKEMIEMQDKALTPQVFALERIDLDALRWATKFTSLDPNRPVLQGIYLDVGGKIVSTDGSRLFLWTSEALGSLSAPVLVGPWHGVEIPPASSGMLELGATDANLRIEGGTGFVVPLMEGAYAQYEQVIPSDGATHVIVPAGDLLEAVDQIESQLKNRHPVDPQEKWIYQPQVEIRLSGIDQTLSLLTTNEMGYHLPKGEEDTPHNREEGAVWTFITSVKAEIAIVEGEDIFRIAVNHGFLSDVLRALELKPTQKVRISFIDPEKVIQFVPVDDLGRKTLLMPMRMKMD
jgi:RNA polymerase sigma-70 factor, ECF subfamily